MLSTVKVPKAFEPLFAEAEAKVKQFFDQQKANPSHGSIEIHGSRYVLVRGAAFSVEFFQLVRKIFGDGHQQDADRFSAGILYELAHSVGQSDAKQFHATMNLSDPVAKLSAGPVHFAHSGWAFVDILDESNPSPDENFCLVYKHPYSFECDAWLNSKSDVEHPVCIMNAGYSSGWCQESFGISLEAREITCRSMEQEDCLFIMAPPHLIEQKIQDFVQRHPELSITDSELAFVSEQPGLFHQAEAGQASFNGMLQQRLLAYARNLEATQQQLSENIEQLKQEIKRREQVEAQLLESEKRWRELSDATFDAIIVVQNDQVVSANRVSETLFDLPHQKIESAQLSDLFAADTYKIIVTALNSGDKEINNLKVQKDEVEKFVDIQFHQSVFNEQPAVMCAIRDITERAVAMQRLERLANFDALTGLPNRTLFQRVVNRSLLSSNFSHKHGLLFLDLDNFKIINDTHGHSAGDLLLFEVANRLSNAIRGSNTICRLGGDEFGIWVPDISTDEAAKQVALQIIEALKEPFRVSREQVRVTFSIGVAIYPHDGTDYTTLTRNSDMAMYDAKNSGKNRYSCYSAVRHKAPSD